MLVLKIVFTLVCNASHASWGEGGGFGISPSESVNHAFEGGKASKRSRAAGKWRGLVVLSTIPAR